MYQAFGKEVKFTLNPFVFGSARKLQCFDEPSPCMLEQTSMCVIKVARDGDKQSAFPGQSVYVPWLVCMDSSKDKTPKCHAQVGIDASAVNTCLSGPAIKTLLQQYKAVDDPINATPTVKVNGKKVKTSYRDIHEALCAADPGLSGCASPLPTDADREVSQSQVPSGDVAQNDVVV